MVKKDHTRLLADLKAYATKKGMAIPNDETSGAAKDLDFLAGSDGKRFDEKWCDALIDKHEKSINKFERRRDKTEDVELKNWIDSALPALKSHLEILKKHEEKGE